MQDPIVMKKDWITDLRSFLKISCHAKFRFAEREAQCILGECGPLNSLIRLKQWRRRRELERYLKTHLRVSAVIYR